TEEVRQNSKLILNNIEEKDAGSYECVAENAVDTALTKIIEISVNAPVISPVLNERFFNENSDSSITCAIETGSEPIAFQWSKNGNPISELNS
ncbi:cell adhesion molecule-like protein, partial [Leptotrombidium deliense]